MLRRHCICCFGFTRYHKSNLTWSAVSLMSNCEVTHVWSTLLQQNVCLVSHFHDSKLLSKLFQMPLSRWPLQVLFGHEISPIYPLQHPSTSSHDFFQNLLILNPENQIIFLCIIQLWVNCSSLNYGMKLKRTWTPYTHCWHVIDLITRSYILNNKRNETNSPEIITTEG